MEWLRLVAFLTLTCVNLSDTFILPLKTTNGSLDLEHLVGYMTLLEQTIAGFQQMITGFQQTLKNKDVDIAVLKSEIANLKTNQQVISGHTTDLASLKTEMSTLKRNQQVITSHQVISLTSKFSNLTQDYQSLFSHLKNDVTAAKMQMTQVSNEVISLESKFNNLTLSRQVMSDQNLTGTVHAIKDTLTRVLGRVQSADNDRTLLHDSVNTLKKTVSTLSNNPSVNKTALSAEIALLKTEVGFNIWLGPRVNLTASRWTTLKFKDIRYNKGDGYNTTTGVFTAPVSGTYLFWTQVHKLGGPYLALNINKGDGTIGYSYTPTAGELPGSVMTTAAVTAGEQVSVSVIDADSAQCCYYSTFGGALLYRH